MTGAGADEARAKIENAIGQAHPGKSAYSIKSIFDEAFQEALARERKEFFHSCIQWQNEWPVGVMEFRAWATKQEAS
jgi:hypothetical protein